MWGDEIGEVARVISSRVSRRDLRAHAESYLHGLIQPCGTENGWQLATGSWQLAEELGEQTPKNLQHVIARALFIQLARMALPLTARR